MQANATDVLTDQMPLYTATAIKFRSSSSLGLRSFTLVCVLPLRGWTKVSLPKAKVRTGASLIGTHIEPPTSHCQIWALALDTRGEIPMRFLFFCVIIALDLLVATASSGQTVNWGAKSALLELGMTEQQVTKTVGSAPNKVEMETCGQHTKRGAWRCKVHTYGSGSNKLRVWFQQSPNDRMWHVVSWGP
jgi:hypothetical protein